FPHHLALLRRPVPLPGIQSDQPPFPPGRQVPVLLPSRPYARPLGHAQLQPGRPASLVAYGSATAAARARGSRGSTGRNEARRQGGGETKKAVPGRAPPHGSVLSPCLPVSPSPCLVDYLSGLLLPDQWA